MTLAESTAVLKSTCLKHGFDAVGLSKAIFLEEDKAFLTDWLERGYHAGMGYLERNQEKRLDPRELVEGTRTVVSLLYNYYSPPVQPEDSPKVARYAYGNDYHKVIKKKLKSLCAELEKHFEGLQYRYFVDSAPLLERRWAQKSGLGWIGKNTMLINKAKGSYFFLAEILLNRDFEPDAPTTDHCGSCRACIDACPTQAILEKATLDATKCISYLNIEMKEGNIDPDLNFENWVFGCDICQEVCPWNRFSIMHEEKAFLPNDVLPKMRSNDWDKIDEEAYLKLSKGSAIKRAGLKGLERTLKHLKQSQKPSRSGQNKKGCSGH